MFCQNPRMLLSRSSIYVGSPLFTARRYASAVYAVDVCLSVRLSHADIVSKRLNVESREQRHTIAQRI